MRPVTLLLSTALFAAAAAPAFAQQPGVAAPEAVQAAPQQPAANSGLDEERVNQLIIYGDDPCPPSSGDEITVCARLPEDDRFRIPPNLRNDPNDPAGQSWANRAIELSYAGRTGTDSCSTVGGGGFTGCFNQIVRQARAERANADQVNWNQLIEQARQERLSGIDAAAREEEAAVRAEEEANQPD
jgi:hypothetical protein